MWYGIVVTHHTLQARLSGSTFNQFRLNDHGGARKVKAGDLMCQNEDFRPPDSHNISECNPFLTSEIHPCNNIDDLYHSFPSPSDESSWTSRFSKLRKRDECSEPQRHNDEKDRSSSTVVLFGQSIAVALAIGNFSISSLENRYNIHMPVLTMGVVYAILSLHLIYHFSRQRYENWHSRVTCADSTEIIQNYDAVTRMNDSQQIHYFPFTRLILQTPWQAYLLLAILDVEANYLTMLSFRHTSLSSSMLLTSLSVFSTLLFRRCIFDKASTTYNCKNMVGVFISVVGACLWIKKDFHHVALSGRNALYGDLLAVSSSLLYGLNDVLLEYTVKANNDRIEYLGMIGVFGFLFSFCIQAPIFERQELVDQVQNFSRSNFANVSVLALIFVMVMSYFYISVTIFLSVNDATILNLSLQSSPLWAVILNAVVDVCGGASSELPPIIFFVALSMVVSGMVLYESRTVHDEQKSIDNRKYYYDEQLKLLK